MASEADLVLLRCYVIGKQAARRWSFLSAGFVLGIAVITGVCCYLVRERGLNRAAASSLQQEQKDAPQRVETIRPKKGGLERVSTQPGTLIAYEAVDLFSKVPGFLAEQSVDIGSKVKKGQQVARIDVPEYVKQVERDAADVERAKANVKQMEARVVTAEAEVRTAEAGVALAQATQASAAATRAFREKQYQRIKSLFQQNSVDERLVDEKEDQRDAAIASENAAKAGIVSAHAQVAAAAARVLQAKADLDDARAKLDVAKAEMARAMVFVAYSHIQCPFDGVVTNRRFFPGDYIVSADGGSRTPLLSVARTDRLRVVVQIPDRDVPYANPGDEAAIEVDAMPGRKFKGIIARIADSEDPLTRTMRVEIDLPNPADLFRPGMYGRVNLVLEKGAPGSVTIPTQALVGEIVDGVGHVHVVREGKAHLTTVKVGTDNGVQCEIRSGLQPEDEVILGSNGIAEGLSVTPASSPRKAH